MASRTISTRLVVEGERETKKAIEEVNAEYKSLQAELGYVKSSLEEGTESMDTAAASAEVYQRMQEALNTKLEQQQSLLDRAKDAQERANKAVGEARDKLASAKKALEEYKSSGEDSAEKTQQLASAVAAAERNLKSCEQASHNAAVKVSNFSTSVYDTKKELNNVQQDMEGTSKNLKEIGDNGKLAESVVEGIADKFLQMATGGAIVGLLADIADKLYQVASAGSEAKAALSASTGATGAELEGMTDMVNNVFAMTVGISREDIAGAMGELNTRFGATGEILEGLTVQVAMYAKATGQDGVSAVKGLSDIIKNWGLDLEDSWDLMNKLTTASQASGISVQRLTSDITTNKATLQNMGYSLEEAIALLSTMELQGLNASQVMSGMRQAAQKMADEGIQDLKLGMDQLFESIKNAASETDALNAASAYFGTEASQEIVSAVRNGRLELDQLAEALANSDNAVGRTYENSRTLGEELAHIGEVFQGNAAAASQANVEYVQWCLAARDAKEASKGTAESADELSDAVETSGEEFKKNEEKIAKSADQLAEEMQKYEEMYRAGVLSAQGYLDGIQSVLGGVGIKIGAGGLPAVQKGAGRNTGSVNIYQTFDAAATPSEVRARSEAAIEAALR